MINNLNRSFMKKKIALKEMEKPTREQYKLNLEISEYNQVTFGSKRLCAFWAQSLQSLPHHIKFSEKLKACKELLKTRIAYFTHVQLVLNRYKSHHFPSSTQGFWEFSSP